MHKKRHMAVLLVLAISIPLLADINQSQVIQHAANNQVGLSGPDLAIGAGINTLSDYGIQLTSAYNGKAVTLEYEDATLYQAAAVGGLGGFGIAQQGADTAAQVQQQTGLGLGNQNQNMGSQLYNQMVGGGDVMAGALQGFVGRQAQIIITPYGMNMNISGSQTQMNDYVRNTP